jgi:hypothetical protein
VVSAAAHNDNGSISIDCDEWISDEHDNPSCTCEPCVRVRSSDEAERRRREALTCGGLFPLAHVLLGEGWVDEDGKGGNVVAQPRQDAVDVKSLAQRALGDVFEQLERVGSAGREKCRPSSTYYSAATPYPAEHRIKRHEAVELLRCAENALDYARVHLDYLERDEVRVRGGRASLQVEPGARVLVADDENASTWAGVLVDLGEGESCRVRDDAGLLHTLDVRDLRAFAV